MREQQAHGGRDETQQETLNDQPTRQLKPRGADPLPVVALRHAVSAEAIPLAGLSRRAAQSRTTYGVGRTLALCGVRHTLQTDDGVRGTADSDEWKEFNARERAMDGQASVNEVYLTVMEVADRLKINEETVRRIFLENQAS